MSGNLIETRNNNYEKIYNNLNKTVLKNFEIIPKRIFTHWHTKNLPKFMRINFEKIIKENPEFEIVLFDNNDCINFLKNYFDQEVVKTYENIIPEAYKCDLWRLCVLYIHGGIYCDIKYEPINNFKFVSLINNEYFVLDRPKFFQNKFGIYNALIVTLPRNSFLYECIVNIVENCKTNFFGNSCLDPTGPGLLAKHFEKYYHNYNFELCNHESCDFIIYKNIKILKIYDKYRDEQLSIQKIPRYSYCWYNLDIYKNHPKGKRLLNLKKK